MCFFVAEMWKLHEAAKKNLGRWTCGRCHPANKCEYVAVTVAGRLWILSLWLVSFEPHSAELWCFSSSESWYVIIFGCIWCIPKKKAHQKQEIARNQCECTLSPDTVPSCTFHHCFPDLDKIPINQGGSPLSPASWSWRSICRPGHCSWSKGCFRPAFSCFRVASWTRNRI